MTELFLDVLNLSISAGWLILAVLALRLLLKKAPKWVNVLLWGIVAVRLICPFSIESNLSLIPDWKIETQDIISITAGESKGQILDSEGNILVEKDLFGASEGYGQIIGSDGSVILEKPLKPISDSADSAMPDTLRIIPLLWLLGMALMLGYAFFSYLHLKQKVATSVVMQQGIRQSEYIDSPFVLGFIRPVVYLPYGIDACDIVHVIAHEQAHIRRRDHWWKPLGFLLLTIHWFNPLMWVAYTLLCRDIELACDEKVIKELGNEQRADYTQALLTASINRRMIAACPLAFGEVGVKERVRHVLNYRKPTFWIIVTAVVVCVIVAVCFLTDPLDSVDYLIFRGWSDDPYTPNQMIYEINLGNRAMSGEIYVEQWSNGDCVRSAPVPLTPATEAIHLTLRDRWDNGEEIGTDIHIDTDQNGGSLTTYFPYPEEYDGAIWFERNVQDKRIRLSPGKEVILEARAFQCGDGIRPFTAETLITNPNLLKTADYMIVIRAVFSADHLGSADEAAVLKARILGTEEGYFIVEPVGGSPELSTASRILVPMENMEPSPEPRIGDILQIEYDGNLMETYPAQIGKVFRISVISEFVPRQINLNGILYIDTGEAIPVEVDPSAILGTLHTQVEGRPASHGQGNFDCEGCPYARIKGEYAVLIDNEWVRFTEEVLTSPEYYLTIAKEGAVSIEIRTGSQTQVISKDDLSAYELGESVLLPVLTGKEKLRGVTITARDANNEDIFSVSISAKEHGAADTVIECGEWIITTKP